MLRIKIKPEHVAETEAAIGHVFAALEREQPEGVGYLWTRAADGQTFTVQLKLAEDAENPVLTYPEFQQFQARARDWVVEASGPEPTPVVGSYRAF
jgi:hypothetical protein